jgi:nucleoside-diphosphate-sugar epimerase
MKTAFVTGASGYTGSKLVYELLSRGVEVTILKRKDSTIPEYIANSENIREAIYDGTTQSIISALNNKTDVVFHLASCFISRHNTSQIETLINSNILLGTQLMEAMLQTGVKRFVNAGTAWQNIDFQYLPYCLYTSTKQAFEDIIKYYSIVHDISSISLRLCDSFGSDDPRPKIMNLIKRHAKNGETLKMSPGAQELDLVYIDDVVQGFIIAGEMLMSTPKGFYIYALSSDRVVTLKQAVDIFNAVNRTRTSIVWGALPYRENEIMKVNVPRNILPGWRPLTPIEDGFVKMWNSNEKV